MSNLSLKTESKHEENLKRVLGDLDQKHEILRRSFGLFKVKKGDKFSPVAYQRQIRKGWAKRLKRQGL